MGKFKSFLRGLGYVINPLGLVADYINGKNTSPNEPGEDAEYARNLANKVDTGVSNIWDSLTGQTQIRQQNEANKELAQYQAQMNEEFYNKYSSPEAIMRQYQEAGLNPDLMYSSAGSGQGNVPSYQAPTVQRSMSKFEQFQKGLSILSGVMNIQNLMYNTMASREIAEQNGVKTLGLVEDVISKRRNNGVENSIVGWHPSWNFDNLFSRSALGRRRGSVTASLGTDMLERYSDVMRQDRFNKAFKSLGYNMFEFGNYITPYGAVEQFKPHDDWYSNAIWRNAVLKYDSKMRQFTYDWDTDYKTIMKSMGVASPIVQVLLKLLGGYTKL